MNTTPTAAGEALEILIAEDSPTQSQRLQHILKQHGYRVTATPNGRLALEAARQRRPALLISDVVMPEMDGYELCRNIKADSVLAEIPVILVTTLSDPHDVIRGLECRADNFIIKPYDESYLLNRLQFVLSNRELRRSDQAGMALEIYFNGQRHFITADRLQILNLLLSTYDAAIIRNKELSAAQSELREANAKLHAMTLELENRVTERTAELLHTNRALQAEVVERQAAERNLKAQLARLDLLSRITRAIGERQDLHSIFQVVIRSLENDMPIDFGCVALCVLREGEPCTSVTVACVGGRSSTLALDLSLTEQANIPVDENGLASCVQGRLVYEPDVSQIPHPFPQRLAQGGLRSMVAAPLLAEGRVFGLLIATRKDANSFSSGECEFLRQLSEHVALAANQAQLHSELQKTYDDLRQSQQTMMQQERLRALGQMASGIAHDINNAISPVALYTESLLDQEPSLSARARNYLETIQHAIDDVAATVSRMREFYRQREPQMEMAPVAMNRLVQQVLDLTRVRWNDMPQQRGYMVRLVTEFAPDLPHISGVESELRDALTNLIFNAADSMPEDGTLTIRTRVEERTASPNSASAQRFVCAEVIDTGVGMNEDTRRRCLEPFFTTKGERGTGLGLAMVYGAVKRHGAEIEIESEPGRGTVMRLLFPISTGPAAASTAPFVAPPSVEPTRILIVDDDPILIKSLRDTLENAGHVVTATDGGQSGIDAFEAARNTSEPFEVVITDLGMPYLDGRRVAAAIKASSSDTPIIMLTGWGERLVSQGENPSNVDCVLSKPPKLRELNQALARFARARKSIERT